MARRRSFARRRGTGNLVKKRWAWSSAVFGSAIDFSGTPADLTEFIILDALNDLQPGTDYNRKYSVRRVILKGNFLITPLTSAAANSPVQMVSALYVDDREDTDNTLVTTDIGDMLEGGADRVLHTNMDAFLVNEVPSAVISQQLLTGPRIDIDWRGNCKVGLDQLILFGCQVGIDATGAVGNLSAQFICRVLLEAL